MKMKTKPLAFIPKPNEYVINGYADSQGEYSPSFCIFVEHKYLTKEKILRIVYQSDSPSETNVIKFIEEKYPELNSDKVLKIYFDEPWHFNSNGVAYGIILVMFK